MPRRLIVLSALLSALALAATAQAQHSRTSAAARPSVKLADCRSGDTSDARTATFLGRMRSLGSTDKMAMRFTLMERFGDEKLHAVDFPTLRAWHFSKPGIKDFRFKQTVTALQGGGQYRMRVDFRWLDAAGNLQRKWRRTSAPCRLPGALPNLLARTPTAGSGPEGTSVYVVPIANTGKVAAQDVPVKLFVDGAATNVGHIDSVAPGETREVRFTGPVCKHALRVVVDPDDTINESRKSDNTTVVSCPPVGLRTR